MANGDRIRLRGMTFDRTRLRGMTIKGPSGAFREAPTLPYTETGVAPTAQLRIPSAPATHEFQHVGDKAPPGPSLDHKMLASLRIADSFLKFFSAQQSARAGRIMAQSNANAIEYDKLQTLRYGQMSRHRMENSIRATLGAQRAALAAQGANVGFGTAAALQQQTRRTGALNKIAIQKAIRDRIFGLDTHKAHLGLGSRLSSIASDAAGRTSLRSGLLQAASTYRLGELEKQKEIKADILLKRRLGGNNGG